ncbi:hypothetical protein SSP24_08370 [Streptomyces spinoverrucosus]|uniref:Uncharacterized protein n=1 Tax=Streptomyces spinoverrucosus TaxID=284043 RepID=A0A4Y3V7M0_9ACTN|nr:hypothetical protein SSP24_08370 [Streptomyces spinoverrucosus]GHB37599.1 hypothetical protein GCM10010397_04190 [Streptomyces spinoverrucosus]
MTPVVRDVIGGLMAGPDQFRMSVQKDGGLDFPRVHVGEQRGPHPGPLPCRLPVLRGREQRHSLTARGGFLNDVSQDIVSAVPVDEDQCLDARPAERLGYVPYHRVKGHRGNADGPRPGSVLVRAGDRHRRKEVHRVRVGDLPRDGAGDQRVRRQRKERTVLFEAPHGKDGDLP